ncbi:MAG: 3-phosphoshikimate 1-carboxyvinyltransferase [Alphaproteobacteria bacterium CG_4_9_14_3_um_filter_47_13]|nr:MAG: 3-phosphoshikimate 1-carboxyvinyltransferase [Alphaproteobacteria bacterium CG_4_9_14_3_um_filter_47_13]
MSFPHALRSAKTQSFHGTARIPGDKSMSHRALILGLLTREETMISGLLEGEDVLNTAQAVRQLGGRVNRGHDGLWRVFGTGLGNLHEPDSVLDMGNSGTSTRLLMGLIAGHPVTATLTGDSSLVKRPMGRVIDPLQDMGAQCLGRENNRLPLTIKGSGHLRAIDYEMPVASAQVKSAILLAGLNIEGVTTVIEKIPTRDHTENMLRHFGIEIDTEILKNGGHAIRLKGRQRLHGCAIDIPGDPSSASFPVVAALLIDGAEIRLSHICINERRTGLFQTLIEMGADITFKNRHSEAGEQVADILVKGGNRLAGIRVPPERVASMIDEFPVLAVAASCAKGITTMTGLSELRVKESDRLARMAQGLLACGVRLEEGEESLIIHGTGKPPRGGVMIDTMLDHRIAMSFLVLGCVTDDPVEIDDARPIHTSFPDFIKIMNNLGAHMTDIDKKEEKVA